MSGQSTWADLPPEIVDQTLGYCDEQSLLLLSRVNHQLNYLALFRYFAPQIVGDLIQLPSKFSEESLLPELWKQPPPIHILLTAFWLPGTIQHIDYCLPSWHGYIKQFINDLRVLTAFIHRMPKLASLRINSGKSRSDLKCQGICNELLAAAISKGCGILEIKEGGLVYDDVFWFPDPRSLSTSILRLGPWLVRNFSQAFAPRTKVKPFLQDVQVDGGSFKNWPIFPIILAQHVNSITRLSLTNLRTYVSTDIAAIFNIHFPALKSFTFSTYRKRIPSTIFLKFIFRHRTLIDLDIDGRPLTKPKWLLWWNPPVFPNLQHLGMSPITIAWLMIDFRRCPKLRSVSLKGIDQDSWQFCWGTGEMHGAIGGTLVDLHISPSMVCPLKVEITFPLEDLHRLVACYIIEGGKPLPLCSRVKELRLKDANWYKSLSEFTPNPAHLGVLVDWLSTFPSLEFLEIASSTPTLGKEFVGMVLARCPKLRSFGYPYLDKFHDKLGQKWKMWDVQNGRIEGYTTIWRSV